MKELAHLDEFQAILENQQTKYRPSEANQAIVKQAEIALFIGPTNAGRNTIINKLLPTGKYYFIVSDTTRPPKLRNGVPEENGVNYWFRSEEEVLEDLKAGAFVEAALIHEQQVSGISVREIAKATKDHKIAVTDIEIVGAENIKEINPRTMCLFVLPPSFAVWQSRLKQRGDLSGKPELLKRMRSAVKEFRAALKHSYYWFVINDDLDSAVAYTDKIITTQQVDPAHQKAGRALAEDFLQETIAYLEANHG